MIYLGDNWPDRYRGKPAHLQSPRPSRQPRPPGTQGIGLCRAPRARLPAGQRHLVPRPGAEVRTRRRGLLHRLDGSRRMPRDRRRQRPPRERPDLQARLRQDQAGPGQPGGGDSLRNWPVLQLHKNDWHVRTARRLLQERAAQGADLGECSSDSCNPSSRPTRHRPAGCVRSGPCMPRADSTTRRLIGPARRRGRIDPGLGDSTCSAIAALPRPEALVRFVALARSDPSPRVRLSLASALQRIPVKDRWPLAEALAAAKIDPKDPMLPLMTWYGIEPLAGQDPSRASALAARCKLPLLRNFLARRAVTADAASGLSALLPVLEQSTDAVRRDILSGHPGRPPRPQAGSPTRGLAGRVREAAGDARPGRSRADTAPGA